MLHLALKAAISGLLVAAASEAAKRYPGCGTLIASLPLVSILGMIWLWRDKPDPINISAHVGATFWFLLPSLTMFLVFPALLDRGGALLGRARTRMRPDRRALWRNGVGSAAPRTPPVADA